MLHHINATTEGVQVAVLRGASRRVTVLDDTSVEARSIDEGVGIEGIVALVVLAVAVGGKPHHMVRVAGEARVVLLLAVVPFEGSHHGVVVAGEDGGILEVVAHETITMRLFILLQGADGHIRDFRRIIICEGRVIYLAHIPVAPRRFGGEHTGVGVVLRVVGVETAIDMYAVVDLERCRQHRGTVAGTLRRRVACRRPHTRCRVQAVALHVVVEVVDGVLHVVLGRVPRLAVVGVLYRSWH